MSPYSLKTNWEYISMRVVIWSLKINIPKIENFQTLVDLDRILDIAILIALNVDLNLLSRLRV